MPPGQVLRATITPPMSFGQLQAFTFEACGGACATVTRALAADGSSVVVRAANHGAAASDLLLAVNDAVTPRRFDITAALSPAPLNVSCAGAIELTDGAHLRGEDPAVSNARVVPCSSSVARTNALFYTADVAAGHALAVDVATDPIVGSPYMVEVHGACPARSCLAWNRTSDRRALTTWINEGATPRRVTVIVAPYAGDGTPFDLRATIRPPPLNRTCAGAARLSAGVLIGENVAFAREPSVACIGAGGSMYRGLYYVARVEPRVRLTVTAQSASVAPMVRLAGGCDGAVCLATSTSSGFGNARATWTNTEGAARDVLVVVSTTSTIVEGTLDLTTALDPP